MLIVISPAKTLDYESPVSLKDHTTPQFINDSQQLIRELRKLAPHDISELMHISDKLGALNYDRYKRWKPEFTDANSRQAILAFRGDVYTGIEADTFKTNDFKFAQKHLRILSGLYGLLRPLDLMQPYRLEMGTKFQNKKGKDLYSFWGNKLTDQLNSDIAASNSNVLINLASNEYFKAVKPKQIKVDVVSPVFKDWKNGQYKIISFFAKKARGMMSAYIIKNRLSKPEQLQAFNTDGYHYNAALSTPAEPVFTRKITA